MMRVSIILYPFYDADLIMLSRSPQLHFPTFVKQAVSSYAKGELYQLELYPPLTCQTNAEYQTCFCGDKDADGKTEPVYIRVSLDDSEELTALVSSILPRCKNNFLKNLLRASIRGGLVSAFLTNSGMTAAQPVPVTKAPAANTEAVIPKKPEKAAEPVKPVKNPTTDIPLFGHAKKGGGFVPLTGVEKTETSVEHPAVEGAEDNEEAEAERLTPEQEEKFYEMLDAMNSGN